MPPSVRGSKDNLKNEAAFIRELEAVNEYVEQLTELIQNGKVESAGLRSELKIMYENVREISALLRGSADGKTSILTRLALIEQGILNLQKEVSDNDDINKADVTGQWQMKTALVTGVIGLLASILSVLFSMNK